LWNSSIKTKIEKILGKLTLHENTRLFSNQTAPRKRRIEILLKVLEGKKLKDATA
jgi:hypothetical protein